MSFTTSESETYSILNDATAVTLYIRENQLMAPFHIINPTPRDGATRVETGTVFLVEPGQWLGVTFRLFSVGQFHVVSGLSMRWPRVLIEFCDLVRGV